VRQVAAQQHQVSLTEYYDLVLAHEPPPPALPTNNPTLNVSLHRLNQALQAALHSIGGDVPEETSSTSEGADATAEEDDSHQPHVPPPSEPQPRLTSLLEQSGAESRVIQYPEPHAATDQHSESEAQTPPSPPGPYLSHITATATSDDSASATSISASTSEPPFSSHLELNPEPEPEPEPESELKLGPDPDPEREKPEPELESEPAPEEEVDWAETRELEIARLGSENARLRALLGIDPTSLAASGIPDIDPEPPAMSRSFFFHGGIAQQAPVAAGSSSAWANGGAEATNPFTLGFREDPSVLGLAATPSRLHTLTPPDDPAAANGSSGVGTLANRASGVFVTASWVPFNGNGNGAGVGVGLPGQGPMAAQMQQQQKPPPHSLGIPGLARTMELQGPGIGPGAGRGRGVLFGGRGRSVGW
jgi:hypothetical protein